MINQTETLTTEQLLFPPHTKTDLISGLYNYVSI